jgi:hypothetical protein
MKALFFAFALLPQFAFAGSIILTLNADLRSLKVPGEVLFESTNIFCEERGLIPQPWSAPKRQKVVPKIILQTATSLVLEVSTEPKKQDFCNYKFSHFTLWSDDGSFFVSLEAANKINLAGKDAPDLELTTNLNSLYTIDCLAKKNYQRHCSTFKDGVKKGYSSGNGSRLLVDMKRLESQKEIRPVVEFKKRSE